MKYIDDDGNVKYQHYNSKIYSIKTNECKTKTKRKQSTKITHHSHSTKRMKLSKTHEHITKKQISDFQSLEEHSTALPSLKDQALYDVSEIEMPPINFEAI